MATRRDWFRIGGNIEVPQNEGVDPWCMKRLHEHGLRQACISAECSAIHQMHKQNTGKLAQNMKPYGWEDTRPHHKETWHKWSTQASIGERSYRDGTFLPFLFGCPECGSMPEDGI